MTYSDDTLSFVKMIVEGSSRNCMFGLCANKTLPWPSYVQCREFPVRFFAEHLSPRILFCVRRVRKRYKTTANGESTREGKQRRYRSDAVRYSKCGGMKSKDRLDESVGAYEGLCRGRKVVENKSQSNSSQSRSTSLISCDWSC